MEKIVGHKTLIEPNGMLRHEPLTESEAVKIMEACEAERLKREADMPTAKDAAEALFDAWYRLKELGWKNCQRRENDGKEVDVIELGSSGIHRTSYPSDVAVLFRAP